MAVETSVIEPRATDRPSRVSWGAIFAGGLVTLGVQLLFLLLGGAIGLSILHPGAAGAEAASEVGIGAGIYFFITMLISFFIGGYVTTRLGGVYYRASSALHGLTTWALVTAFFAFAVSSGIGSLVGGMWQATAGAGQAAAQAAGQQSGMVEKAKKQADKLQSQAKQNQEQIKQQAQQAGQVAASVATGTSWYAFATLLLGALAAMYGGITGNPDNRFRKHGARERNAA